MLELMSATDPYFPVQGHGIDMGQQCEIQVFYSDATY